MQIANESAKYTESSKYLYIMYAMLYSTSLLNFNQDPRMAMKIAMDHEIKVKITTRLTGINRPFRGRLTDSHWIIAWDKKRKSDAATSRRDDV